MGIAREQILIVDDEEDLRQAIVEILTSDGFEVCGVATAEQAQEMLSQTPFDVLITDNNLPGKSGVDLLEETLSRYPEIVGIVITGFGTVETAVHAIKTGAYNYLSKPFKLIELSIMVRKGLRERTLRFENQYLRNQLRNKYAFDNIIGTGRSMGRIFELINSVAGLNSTVLIQGETGTGKELIAKAIHFNSPRKDQKMVSINCGAIPENLLESELFGHVKGAFTGAVQNRIGKFEQGNNGTIFLDEIGNMPPSLQVKLLRILQEREFERVGGTRTIRADVRVIAATNRDLKAAMTNGTFRSDLYYRLQVFPIEIRSLRERKEDIPLLVEYFIDRYASKMGKRIRSVKQESLDLLRSYSWPGNIRELQNIIERAVIVSEGDVLWIDESWLSIESARTEAETGRLSRMTPEEEKTIIEGVLAETRGRVSGASGAARKLGIPPTTLESRIRALKINKHRFRSSD